MPGFDPDTKDYTATTTNNTNTITATPQDLDATVTIKVNGKEIQNGTPTSWEEGENTVLIVVENGAESEEYTVIVTKE